MGTTLHILYLHVQEHTHQSPQILSTIRAQGLLLIFAILSFTAMNRTEANKQSLRLIIIGIDHPRVLHPQMLLLLQLIPIDGPWTIQEGCGCSSSFRFSLHVPTAWTNGPSRCQLKRSGEPRDVEGDSTVEYSR